MTHIEHNNQKISVYSSIKELPIERHKAMQTMLLQDSGIGNTIQDIDKRFQNLMLFASSGKTEDTYEEIKNLRYTFFSALMKLDYKTRSFACLVHSINGEIFDDISDEGLKSVASKLEKTGISIEELEKHFDEVKKKLI